MSDNCDSSDGFEIVDIISRQEHSEISIVSKLPEERNDLPVHADSDNIASFLERNLPKEQNINTKKRHLEVSSGVSNSTNEVHCKRKNAIYEGKGDREHNSDLKRQKSNLNDQNVSNVVVLLSSSGDEDSGMSRSLVNTSEFMIVEENIENTKKASKREQVNNLEKFFNDSSSFLDEICLPGITEKFTQDTKNNKTSLFLSSYDDDDDDLKSDRLAITNSQEPEAIVDNYGQPRSKGLREKFFLSSVESSIGIENKGNTESLDSRNLENDVGNKSLDFAEPPIAETSFVFDNNTKNRSLSLKAIDIDSDDNLSRNSLLSNLNTISSDWRITQHPKYLATITLTSADLETQLKLLHANKVTKQKYSFANKVNKNFKKDIVLQELFLTTNMDIPLKNDDPSLFYLSNNDLMIKKRELSTLNSAINNIKNNVEGLKFATFTRRLTSVLEMNSCIFLPISALLENGNSNDRTQKLDFVDVDMVECILMLDIQKFYEIFHFKENESKKQLLDRFFSENKKITLVLTNTSKFLSNLNKWENMKQLHKYNDINKNESLLKNNRKKIPEQYVNLSAVEVQSSILKIQMMYKTHISIQQIETEIQFINDWFLNYLKTILRARYTQPKEEQNTFTSLQAANTFSGNQNSFNSFLLGLNGITRNNIEIISEMLGNNFNDMQKSVTKLRYMNKCQGAQKKVLDLMDKFLKYDDGEDIL